VSKEVVPGAVAQDVLSCLGWFPARAFILAIQREGLSELACVVVTSSALERSSKKFAVVFLGSKVVRWRQRGGEAVGYCEPASKSGFPPLALPEFGGSYFSAS